MINKKLLEYSMRNESKIKRAVKMAKMDVQRDGGRKSGISRPTEAQALFNLTYTIEEILIDGYILVRKPEMVLRLIKYIKEYCNLRPEGEIYKHRYILHQTGSDYYGNDKKRQYFYYKSIRNIIRFGLRKAQEIGL